MSVGFLWLTFKLSKLLSQHIFWPPRGPEFSPHLRVPLFGNLNSTPIAENSAVGHFPLTALISKIWF